MGNICNGHSHLQQNQNPLPLSLDSTFLPLFAQQSPLYPHAILASFTKFHSFSLRFPSPIHHFLHNNNTINSSTLYKLILQVQNERNQLKTIQTKILTSQVDMELENHYKYMKINDMKRAVIIDRMEGKLWGRDGNGNKEESGESIVERLLNGKGRECNRNRQIYHKVQFNINNNNNNNNNLQSSTKIMKYTTFTSFTDYSLKQSLYQLSLYTLLRSSSPLFYHYIINHQKHKHLIMLFQPAYGTLQQIIQYRRMFGLSWKEREILLIGKMLVEGYMELRRVGIVHRDVRPGMVFFREGSKAGRNNNNINNNNKKNRDNSLLQSSQLYQNNVNNFHVLIFIIYNHY